MSFIVLTLKSDKRNTHLWAKRIIFLTFLNMFDGYGRKNYVPKSLSTSLKSDMSFPTGIGNWVSELKFNDLL